MPSRPWPRESLVGASLSTRTSEFLLSTGLPDTSGWFLRLECPNGPVRPLRPKGQYLLLASDGGLSVCLDESHGERVVAVSVDEDDPMCVASSVWQFADLVSLFADYLPQTADVGRERAKAVYDSLERDMRLLDPAAFADDEFWWPLVLEQFRSGLFD